MASNAEARTLDGVLHICPDRDFSPHVRIMKRHLQHWMLNSQLNVQASDWEISFFRLN